jgi:hypothetical protein
VAHAAFVKHPMHQFMKEANQFRRDREPLQNVDSLVVKQVDALSMHRDYSPMLLG